MDGTATVRVAPQALAIGLATGPYGIAKTITGRVNQVTAFRQIKKSVWGNPAKAQNAAEQLKKQGFDSKTTNRVIGWENRQK